MEPLRPAVIVKPRRRWLPLALALSVASTVAAGAAAVATVLMHPPDAPAPEIRFVEVRTLRIEPPPVASCDHAYLQRTVYRTAPPVVVEVNDVTGTRTRTTCIETLHGELAVTRAAGADRTFGTSDDVCTVAEGCPLEATPPTAPQHTTKS